MVTLRDIRHGNHDKLRTLFKNVMTVHCIDYVKMACDSDSGRVTRYNGFLKINEDISLEHLYNLILETRNEISNEDKQHHERAIGKFQGVYQFTGSRYSQIYIPDITMYIGLLPRDEHTQIAPIKYISLLYYPTSQSKDIFI